MPVWTGTGALGGHFNTCLPCSVKEHPLVFTLATAVVQCQEVSKPAASQPQNRISRMSSSLLQEGRGKKKKGKFQYLFCQNRRGRDPVQRENNLV